MVIAITAALLGGRRFASLRVAGIRTGRLDPIPIRAARAAWATGVREGEREILKCAIRTLPGSAAG